MSEDLVFGLYIFALATFVGYQVIEPVVTYGPVRMTDQVLLHRKRTVLELRANSCLYFCKEFGP